MIEIFPYLTVPIIYMILPITSCEAERNFPKLSIIVNHVRAKAELLVFLSIGDLRVGRKKCRKMYYRCYQRVT